MKNYSIKIPSKRESVRIAENFIEEAKKTYSITDDLYGNLMVAVIESVSNAIIHGNKQDETKNVSLKLYVNTSEICVEVTDQGNGYDYNNIPDPTLPENLEKPGGRGIFLMKKLCDKVNFYDKGRKIKLIFNV